MSIFLQELNDGFPDHVYFFLSYVDSLSRCLHIEYKEKGIHTQCQVG